MLSILLGVLLLFASFFSSPPLQSSTKSGWLAPFPGVQRPQTIPYRSYPRLLHRVEPVYPAAGTVHFELIINEKGEVWQARVLSSPSPLVGAALDAVRQWQYVPTIIDGLPVPVITTASVTLGSRAESSRCGAEPPRREPLRTGGNVLEQKLLHRVEPVYPQGVSGNGVIILQVTINEQGYVYEARMLRGPSMLEQAVLAAVCQWKYSPTYLNGVAVPVIATVTIEFNLLRPR
jgi:TonB family protein